MFDTGRVFLKVGSEKMHTLKDTRIFALQPTSDPFARALAYSIVIHLCVFALSTGYGYINHSFAKPTRVVYSIQLGEIRTGSGSGNLQAGSTSVRKSQTVPERKPKSEKAAPKLPAKSKPKSPSEKKNVELAKLAKAPAAKVPKTRAGLEAPEKQTTKVAIGAEPAPKSPVSTASDQPVPSDNFDDDVVAATSIGPDDNESGIIGPENAGGSISPELRWYVEILRRKVRQNWAEPRYLLPPGSYASAVIRCEIGRDGTLASDPLVFESSKIPDFDLSGYGAVVRAAPFPPLPESLQRNSMGIRFKFEFGETT